MYIYVCMQGKRRNFFLQNLTVDSQVERIRAFNCFLCGRRRKGRFYPIHFKGVAFGFGELSSQWNINPVSTAIYILYSKAAWSCFFFPQYFFLFSFFFYLKLHFYGSVSHVSLQPSASHMNSSNFSSFPSLSSSSCSLQTQLNRSRSLCM